MLSQLTITVIQRLRQYLYDQSYKKMVMYMLEFHFCTSHDATYHHVVRASEVARFFLTRSVRDGFFQQHGAFF